ncbi:hypothetical protein [Acidovorax sp.]|uniref:hypothetical protein n=1 Tax=Acidovorax sp. TaxID=1872122 RepID=UPI003CFF2B44
MATAPTIIPAGPPVPDSSDPEVTFDDQFEAFLKWQSTELQPKANTQAQGVYDNAVLVEGATVAVVAAAGAAGIAASAAAASAASALNSPGTNATSTTSLTVTTGAKSWVLAQTGKAFAPGQPILLARAADPTIQMMGTLLTHNPANGACTADMTTAKGAVGPHTDWIMSLGMAASAAPPTLIIEARSSNTALAVGDTGKLILASGSWTQTINAVAGLGNGWQLEYENAGNGTIVLDPNASELIDGQTTYSLLPGWRVRLQGDGTKITVTVLRRRHYGSPVLVTATGTTIVPPDTYVLWGLAVGRGGTGTAGPQTGGGGGCAFGDIAVTPGQTVNFDITSGVAKIIVGGVDMLTANPASVGVAGTASKHASVTNGGNYSGGAGMASAGGGASSGSPLGVGVSSLAGSNGGCGWGGAGTNNNGGGTGGPAPVGGARGGPAISSVFKSSNPLLALLDGTPGANSNVSYPVGGGPGAGGGGSNSASYDGAPGGFGAGGGGNPSGNGGAGGFGAGGSRGGSSSTGGAPGYGGGAPDGGSIVGGAAAIIYFMGG